MENFWLINGNFWSCDKYTELEAFEMSKTLKNCEGCTDCENCVNCKECYNCECISFETSIEYARKRKGE